MRRRLYVYKPNLHYLFVFNANITGNEFGQTKKSPCCTNKKNGYVKYYVGVTFVDRGNKHDTSP